MHPGTTAQGCPPSPAGPAWKRHQATTTAGREFLLEGKPLYVRPPGFNGMISTPAGLGSQLSLRRSSRFTHALLSFEASSCQGQARRMFRSESSSFLSFSPSKTCSCRHWAKLVPQFSCLLNLSSAASFRGAKMIS